MSKPTFSYLLESQPHLPLQELTRLGSIADMSWRGVQKFMAGRSSQRTTLQLRYTEGNTYGATISLTIFRRLNGRVLIQISDDQSESFSGRTHSRTQSIGSSSSRPGIDYLLTSK